MESEKKLGEIHIQRTVRIFFLFFFFCVFCSLRKYVKHFYFKCNISFTYFDLEDFK